VNYAEQQQYLRASRWWAIAIAALLLLMPAWTLVTREASLYSRLCYALIIVAIAISILYTPNYLHLTVNAEKPGRWQIKIRWRIIAAVLILGLIPTRSLSQVAPVPGSAALRAVLGSVAWLVIFNLGAPSFGRLCRRVGMPDLLPGYFLSADYLLLAGWILFVPPLLPWIMADFAGKPSLLIVAFPLAAAAHLCVAIARRPFTYATIATIASAFVLKFFVARVDRVFRNGALYYIGPMVVLVIIAAFGTAFLVHRAHRRNRANVATALAELTQFTGYSEARVRELWATADRQLAANWQSAKLDGASPEKLAAWYRDNSELYLFAISAYNLDYKRIVSNLGVLRLARGRTLDYGAGNGELLLELARRGHATAYYDVEGRTMQFARSRAQQRGLSMQFFSKKSELAAAAQVTQLPDSAITRSKAPVAQSPDHTITRSGFDTVFSFDVLEHLPDLAGELTFLASLLDPGGQFVFDIPSGATRNHPMHLDHQLDFIAHLRSLGLVRILTWRDRLPWRKEEKYRFRRPGSRSPNV
jgi:2-polyprenyl-3-methyl-5-hydroxy-6-metoxy-1,4-benzoquinol methylase